MKNQIAELEAGEELYRLAIRQLAYRKCKPEGLLYSISFKKLTKKQLKDGVVGQVYSSTPKNTGLIRHAFRVRMDWHLAVSTSAIEAFHQIMETVIHEVGHMLEFYLAYPETPKDKHGEFWQQGLREIGVTTLDAHNSESNWWLEVTPELKELLVFLFKEYNNIRIKKYQKYGLTL